jgi:PPOX class probable F420-dependent enzyme
MAESQTGLSAPGFHREVFKADLSTLCGQYKETWNKSPMGASRGPFKILGVTRPYLPEEQIAAERPEEDARQRLVDFASQGIISALQAGHALDALAEVRVQLDRLSPGAIPTYTPDLLQDIFAKTLLEVQPTGKQAGRITQEPSTREIVTVTQFSERARELLGEPLKGVLAVLRPDGRIVQTEMWYALQDDGTILMNTTKFRRKYDHLRQNPAVSLLVSRGNYQYVMMSGEVALNEDPEVAQKDIRFLAERYMGQEDANKIMEDEFSREERVSITLKPTSITEYFSQ